MLFSHSAQISMNAHLICVQQPHIINAQAIRMPHLPCVSLHMASNRVKSLRYRSKHTAVFVYRCCFLYGDFVPLASVLSDIDLLLLQRIKGQQKRHTHHCPSTALAVFLSVRCIVAVLLLHFMSYSKQSSPT